MYYPYGIPTLLRMPQEDVQEIEQVGNVVGRSCDFSVHQDNKLG